MRKNIAKTLICTLCTAAALVGAAGVFALENSATASAQTAQTAQAAARDELISPVSYEQYLRLNDPSSVAVCERYTAIADGNTIYLYNRAKNEYHEYSHTEKISKVQFDERENLYFSDKSTSLYLLDTNGAEPQGTGINCSGFTINGDVIYYTVVTEGNNGSTILSASLSTPSQKTEYYNTVTGNPAIAYYDNELYFTNSGMYLHKFNPDIPCPDLKDTSIGTIDPVNSITVCDGVLAYTSSANEFYVYSLPISPSDDPLFTASGAYKAVTTFDGYIYAVNGDKIEQYSVEEQRFTSYSICSDSSAPNRLSGATDIHLSGDRLLIADDGNRRVSVYDTVNGDFKGNFATDIPASLLSSDGETVLIASGKQAAVYTTDGVLSGRFDAFASEIKGVASVYGKHYLLTSGHTYCISQNAESGEWSLTDTEKRSSRFVNPLHLTSDIYGDLYFTAQTSVYRISEADFMRSDGEGECVYDELPAGVKKLQVDYERNLYALTDTAVYKLDASGPIVDYSAPLVYTQDGVNVTAFALGVEENQTYLLCDGSYLLRSPRLELPTVKTIPVDGADEEIFSENSAEFVVVDVRENALLVAFELETLQDQNYFPYLGYQRQETPLTALRLGETDAYSLIAVYDERAGVYRTYLTLTSFTSVANDQSIRYEETKTGYITSAVTLYKFPYLTDLLVAGSLPRGAKIEVLGELSLDHEYYEIAYEADGVQKTGYIPKSFVSDASGLTPEAETVVYGAEASERDALWRLAYILLGCAAVTILTDYLLLRKRKEERE